MSGNFRFLFMVIVFFPVCAFSVESPIEIFRKRELPGLKNWFQSAEITSVGVLELTPHSRFLDAAAPERRGAVELAWTKWRKAAPEASPGGIIAIKDPEAGSAWAVRDGSSPVLIGTWGAESLLPEPTRFFFSAGLSSSISEEDMTLFASFSLGSYFLNRTWDVALNCGLPLENASFSIVPSFSLRYHLPILSDLEMTFGGLLGYRYTMQTKTPFDSSGHFSYAGLGGLSYFLSANFAFDVTANIGNDSKFIGFGITSLF